MALRKILFISHDALRTGAPILLLNLASALKKNTDNAFEFLLKEGGALKPDFEQLAPTRLIYKPARYDLFSRLKKRVMKERAYFDLSKMPWSTYDVVIGNTITNGDVLPLIRKYYKGTIISYIHELEMAAQFYTTAERIQQLISHTNCFVVPSLAVQNFLETTYGISSQLIKQLPYYIPEFNKSRRESVPDNVTSEIFTVGGSGTIDWRKGPELFIQIAVAVFTLKPAAAIQFTWKGAYVGVELDRLNYAIRKCGLQGKVILEATGADMADFFNHLNLFLLPSREDPYPLVVLEAADYGVPSICFDGVGGAQEFIEGDAGIVVPFLDIQAAANAILELYNDRHLLKTKGEKAKEKVKLKHQNEAGICKQFTDIIDQICTYK